jgi:hypothetical protein
VRSRPFLTRFVFAALGMLLLCLAGVMGAGWAVRRPADGVIRLIGEERQEHLRGVCARLLGRMFPLDSDGDGIPDLMERYLGSDPENEQESPVTGFLVDGQNFTIDSGMTRLGFLLQPGEKRRIRARLAFDREPIVVAKGAILTLHAEDPSLICLPGGTPSGDWLPVPAASDGAVEFDLAIPADARASELSIITRYAKADLVLGFPYIVARRGPAVACTWQEAPHDEDAVRQLASHSKGSRVLRLTWPPVSASGIYYLEATRSLSENDWFVVGICPVEGNSMDRVYRADDDAPGERGPIRFRVAPTVLEAP